jgi:hypothetical protein
MEAGDSTKAGEVWILGGTGSAGPALVLTATDGRGAEAAEAAEAIGGREGAPRGAILVYTAHH